MTPGARWAAPGLSHLAHAGGGLVGVYLVHAFLLTAVLRWAVPMMPADWPTALKVVVTWVLTAGSAVAVTSILLQIPILSRLIGRRAARSAPWLRRRSQRAAPATKQGSADAQQA